MIWEAWHADNREMPLAAEVQEVFTITTPDVLCSFARETADG